MLGSVWSQNQSMVINVCLGKEVAIANTEYYLIVPSQPSKSRVHGRLQPPTANAALIDSCADPTPSEWHDLGQTSGIPMPVTSTQVLYKQGHLKFLL